LEALRARGLQVLGVVLNGASNPGNRSAIERFGAVEILGELELLKPLDADSLRSAAALLDPEERLLGWLTV
jgi:dethiobiotin synthetase